MIQGGIIVAVGQDFVTSADAMEIDVADSIVLPDL